MTELSIKTRAERFMDTLQHGQVLDLSVVSATDDSVTMRLPYQPQVIGDPDSGTLHGGSLTTLVDTASGTAVFAILPGFELCPTLDLRLDYMQGARSGYDLLAVARVIRIASQVVFTECRVYECEHAAEYSSSSEPDGNLIAKCSATFMRIGADMTPADFRARIESGDNA